MILGRVLGDSTDEGIDARTSYQFLADVWLDYNLANILCNSRRIDVLAVGLNRRNIRI